MRFPYELSAALIGTTAAIVIVQPQIVQALTAEELSLRAQEITVLIRNKGDLSDSGSGVIIGKSANQPNIYYVLTAHHVVQHLDIGEGGGYEIVTPDREDTASEEIVLDYSTVQQLTDENGELVDLAILQFTSDRDYRIGILADYDLESQAGSNISQLVFASGWPAGQARRLFNPGLRVGKDLAAALASRSTESGYELLYTSITYPGMSGGPVLDANGYVIAIHGRSEGERVNEVQSGTDDSRLRLGYSLGIPIQTFLTHQTAQEIQTALRVRTDEPANTKPEEIAESLNSFLPEIPTGEREEDARAWVNYGNELWRLSDVYRDAGRLAADQEKVALGTDLKNKAIALQKETIAAYDKAVKKAPDFYQAWLARGNVFTDLERFEDAVNSYERAIETFPYAETQQKYENPANEAEQEQAKRDLDLYASVWRYKGLVLSKLNRYPEAISVFQKVLEINQADFVTWDLQGLAQLELGEAEAALASFERAIELNQEYVYPLIHKGNALAQLDRLEEAIAIYEQVLRIQPNSYGVVFQRSDVLAEYLRRHGETPAALEEVLGIEASDTNRFHRLGLAQFGLTQREAAIASFDRAIASNPDDAAAWAAKGLTLIVDNRYEEARLAFEKALEINPNDPATLEVLEILKQADELDDSDLNLTGMQR